MNFLKHLLDKLWFSAPETLFFLMHRIWTASFNLQVLFSFYFKNNPYLKKAFDTMGFCVTVSSFWYVPHYSDSQTRQNIINYQKGRKSVAYILWYSSMFSSRLCIKKFKSLSPFLENILTTRFFRAVLSTQTMLTLLLCAKQQKFM